MFKVIKQLHPLKISLKNVNKTWKIYEAHESTGYYENLYIQWFFLIITLG